MKNEEGYRIDTLCVIHKHPRVLLGMKKRGLGVGRWNGFGGKVSEGETVEEATRREVKEEIGVNVGDIEKLGILRFEFDGKQSKIEVHVFRAEDLIGEPKETDEMRPQWFDVNQIPFDQMWPDDRFWLPLLLEREKFKGKFLFDNSISILRRELAEVVEL